METIRYFADMADKFSNGHLRWTSRKNVEFLLSDSANIDPLIKELTEAGFPVGGTGASISNMVHTRAGSTATRPPPTPPAS